MDVIKTKLRYGSTGVSDVMDSKRESNQCESSICFLYGLYKNILKLISFPDSGSIPFLIYSILFY